MSRALPLCLLLPAIAACAAPQGPYPSLQPRPAETIDPRLPVVRAVNDRPASADLVARLQSLVAQARAGDGTFEAAAETARRLAASAGARQSESWIAAQQALSAAIAAREPTARAMAEIDAIGAERLQAQGGIAPNELKAIEAASEEVAAIDRRQAAAIDAVQRRLGS